MKKSVFLLPVLVCCALLFLHPFAASAQHKKEKQNDLASEVLQLVNEHRNSMSLSPLISDEIISAAAVKHSKDMGSGKVPFGHQGFDERVGKIRKKINPVYGWAENVAMGVNTANAVVDMWLHSPGHKKNIEGKYNLTGIGIAKGKDGQLYYTQIFINKK